MKLPPPFLEHFLPQPVAVSGGAARMIRIAVTLNSKRKKASVMRMLHAQINKVSSDANLPLNLKSGSAKNCFDLNLERRVALFASCLASFVQDARFGVLQKQVKIAHSLPLCIGNYLVTTDGGEDFHSPFGPRDEDVESPLAS